MYITFNSSKIIHLNQDYREKKISFEIQYCLTFVLSYFDDYTLNRIKSLTKSRPSEM